MNTIKSCWVWVSVLGLCVAGLLWGCGGSATLPTINNSPKANAGADQTVLLAQGVITLDGSVSSDPDGDPLTYQWSLSFSTQTAALQNANSPFAWFTPAASGKYEFVLTTRDSSGATDQDTITINVVDQLPTNQYGLTVKTIGQGAVVPGSGIYVSGTSINIKATAVDGWSFDHWEGDLSGNLNPNALTINSSKTITAVFVQQGTDNPTVTPTPVPGTKKWEFDVETPYALTPTIGSDGTVYTAGTRQRSSDPGTPKVFAINPDGTKKWEFTNGGMEMFGAPVLGKDGTIYVTADKLYALSPNGTKKWEFSSDSFQKPASPMPAIASDGTLYCCFTRSSPYEMRLFAITPDGAKKWDYRVYSMGTNSQIVGSDGTVYVACLGKSLLAIDANGTKKWEYSPVGGTSGFPAIGSDGTIYAAGGDPNNPRLYAVNADGTKRWELGSLGIFDAMGPAIGVDETIYFGSIGNTYEDLSTGKFYAYSAGGTKIWDYSLGGGCVGTPAVASDGTVYAAVVYFTESSTSYTGKLVALNANGTLKWEFTKAGCSSPVIGSDGTVYFGSVDGKLYAIYGSAPTASSDWPTLGHDVSHSGRVGGP